jgi:uncharacterized protein (TIRG00374 family)
LRGVAVAYLVGVFFNNVLPARAGEAARVLALHQVERTSRAEAAATVVLERAYDILCLLVLFFVSLPWLPRVGWVAPAAGIAIGVAVVLAAALVVLVRYGERPLRFVLRPFTRLPFVSTRRAEAAADNLVKGLAALREPRLAAAGLLLTTLSWLALALSMWLAMLGFDLDVSPVAGLLVTIAVNLAMVLPSAPAAVGVFEASATEALNAYGVSDSRALGYALVLHALNFLPFIAIGFLMLHAHATAVRRRAAAAPGS